MLHQEISEKKKKIALIGLGYVGLPIALEFAKKLSVIGFDINKERVEMMKRRIDPSEELESSAFDGTDIVFTADLEELRAASFFIVAVPTPIDEHCVPNLTPLLKASETVGKVLKKGDYVVFESTVYPGCTEDDCVPVLEKFSGLKAYTDFKVGYSPERINPGDKEHTITKITKVVSGNDDEALENIAKVYEMIVKAGVFRAKSIKVAEAAKVIENTQRDLNIALMNELSQIFSRMDINTFDVLEAAGTKWNFLKFTPGLVGGHCIGVDPYYLTYKAKALGLNPQVILSGRNINDSMGEYVAKTTMKKLASLGKDFSNTKILVMGATFKENVSDIRNSKVADVIKELQSFGVKVEVTDPYASSKELQHEYGFGLVTSIGDGYDCILLAVSHKDYISLDEKFFLSISKPNSLFVDLKGGFKEKIKAMTYWSL
jgi:UDP-N-acetyl-D-galactosamine dehydrogenase